MRDLDYKAIVYIKVIDASVLKSSLVRLIKLLDNPYTYDEYRSVLNLIISLQTILNGKTKIYLKVKDAILLKSICERLIRFIDNTYTMEQYNAVYSFIMVLHDIVIEECGYLRYKVK